MDPNLQPRSTFTDLGLPQTSYSSAQVGINPYTQQTYTPRQMAGQLVENIGSGLGIPDRGWSEAIAGGPTLRTNQAYAAGNTMIQTPEGTSFPNPSPAPTQPSGNQDLINQYKARGWTDLNAITADINAGGYKSWSPDGGGGTSALQNEISSGWDSYIRSLDEQLGGLGTQKTAQEGMVGSQYQQGLNTLGLQKTQGEQQLGTERTRTTQNQAKNLRDLSENLRNSFLAGNVYLGSRGAGDSSAANQYSYALTKLGNRQRGDITAQTSNILADIGSRETNLKNVYDTEVRNLEETKNQKMFEISQWFAEQQNAIKQAQAQGQLGKSQDLANLSKDLLNQSLSMINNLQNQTNARRSALESWAISNSQNIQQLKQNMAGVTDVAYNMPQYTPFTGQASVDSAGNYRLPIGMGSATEEKKNSIFG